MMIYYLNILYATEVIEKKVDLKRKHSFESVPKKKLINKKS